jgi:lysozyme
MLAGIDVSHWEGKIDWDKVGQNHPDLKFIIVKATEGGTTQYKYLDSEFENNWKQLVQLKDKYGWSIGAYHYIRLEYDPHPQAEFYLSMINKYGGFLPGVLPPILDLEGTNNGNVSASKVQSRAGEWIKDVDKATGLKTIIYTSPSYCKEKLAASPKGFDWVANEHPLYIANYKVQTPYIPLPWKDYIIWQYDELGKFIGIPGATDRDWFKGTQEDLDKLARKDGTQPPPTKTWEQDIDEWARTQGYTGVKPQVT